MTKEEELNKLEMYILYLGDLCDSPNSLRIHLASACEKIQEKRAKEGKIYPICCGRWKPYLKEL